MHPVRRERAAAHAAALYVVDVQLLIRVIASIALGAGFVLAGFAVLHQRSRGKSWRLPALWIAYLSVLLFTLPVFFILVLGLADTRRSIALTPAGPKDNPDTRNP